MRQLTSQIRFPLVAASLLLTACGSIPTKNFHIQVIDNEEEQVPCLVVVDQDWSGAAEQKQYANVSGEGLDLNVAFHHAEVEIMVAEVIKDPDTGEVSWFPKRATDTDPSQKCKPESRRLRITDQSKQLFILGR